MLKVREAGRIVNVHALLATGVNADGSREILGPHVTSAEDSVFTHHATRRDRLAGSRERGDSDVMPDGPIPNWTHDCTEARGTTG